MADEKNYRARLHLNNGSTVDVLGTGTEEPEEVADELAEELNSDRPKWITAGNVAFFTGAVSAIEIDTFDEAA